MALYDELGYINIPWILSRGQVFNIIVGGRGTGKTFGALKYFIENNLTFFFMRRTQKQINLICKPEFSPFKKLNMKYGWDIRPESIGEGCYAWYKDGGEKPVGYSAALSTIKDIRGFSGDDVKVFLYDEFIPELHEKSLKGEAEAIFNAYETINRNRELEGEPPLIALFFANSNTISNSLFVELGIVGIADKMLRKRQEMYINKIRRLCLCELLKSPKSEEKKQTALYDLVGINSDFAAMALENEYRDRSFENIRKMPLIEFTPIVFVGEICIYRHKSNNIFYVSQHRTGSCPEYASTTSSLTAFRRTYRWLYDNYINGNVYFEEFVCETLLTKYLC